MSARRKKKATKCRRTTRRNPADKESVWYLMEAAKVALKVAKVHREAGKPIRFRDPILGHRSLDGLLRSAIRSIKVRANKPMKNPGGRAGVIYKRVVSIVASGRAGGGHGPYEHRFTSTNPLVRIGKDTEVSLRAGSLVLPAGRKPLWIKARSV